MKYIAVFCSANELDAKYTEPAREFARLIAEKGYHLVWGGTDKGLMREVASGVQAGGGKLIGVTLDIFKDSARQNADEMIVAKTLGERKATMLLRSDAIVVLVGGIGTLDELTEVLELKKQGHHNKTVVVLNTENFYEGLKVQLQKMKDDGFVLQSLDDLVYFADTPEEAVTYIHSKFG